MFMKAFFKICLKTSKVKFSRNIIHIFEKIKFNYLQKLLFNEANIDILNIFFH